MKGTCFECSFKKEYDFDLIVSDFPNLVNHNKILMEVRDYYTFLFMSLSLVANSVLHKNFEGLDDY